MTEKDDELKAQIEAEWDEIDRKLEEEFAEKRKKWNDPMNGWVTVWPHGGSSIQMFTVYGEEMSGGHASYLCICYRCGKKWVTTDVVESIPIFKLCPEHLREVYAFWDNEEERPHMDICDVSTEDFVKMHKNVLKLKKEMSRGIVGHFLMGRYYLDGFSSRSCSGRMASLMNEGDYLNYYCGSSEYATIMEIPETCLPLIEAATKDENGKAFKRLWKGVVEVRTKRLKK